ncbi:ribokinase [Escherichia coli]|nr:ribokinase [Escherichia coli]
MQNAGSLVVLGSINADHILNLQSFPTPGETVTGNHYQVAFGGKGANQAVAAGRSGANIAFIACTGDDSIGESVRQQLATDNIDISPVSVIKGESTGVALILLMAKVRMSSVFMPALMLPFPRHWWKRNVSVLPTRQHY